MRKTQTGAKRGVKTQRINWKKTYVQICKDFGDQNIQFDKLTKQLADEKKAHEQTAELANERLAKIKELTVALGDTQNAEATAKTELQLLINEIDRTYDEARGIDTDCLGIFELDLTNHHQRLQDLLQIIDYLINALNETELRLETEKLGRAQAEAVSEKLEQLLQETFQQLINRK